MGFIRIIVILALLALIGYEIYGVVMKFKLKNKKKKEKEVKEVNLSEEIKKED